VYAARFEKVANAVEARLAIHMKPVVVDGIEGSKGFAGLSPTLLEILVEHLFPASCVDAGRIRYHPVEVEKHGVVPVAYEQDSAAGVWHRSLSRCQGKSLATLATTLNGS
jgi:hypothetical protein